jgi:hypothetical protein
LLRWRHFRRDLRVSGCGRVTISFPASGRIPLRVTIILITIITSGIPATRLSEARTTSRPRRLCRRDCHVSCLFGLSVWIVCFNFLFEESIWVVHLSSLLELSVWVARLSCPFELSFWVVCFNCLLSCLFVESVCGICLWNLFVESVCGVCLNCLFELSVLIVC